MIFLRGVNVIRIVELGASFAQGPFSRKLDLEESHVREMNMKCKYAMKILVQVIIKRLNRILTQHIQLQEVTTDCYLHSQFYRISQLLVE